MAKENLNKELYDKMSAEQETYKKWLLEQPPEEILKHTYEYTVREDILMAFENHDISDEQAAALLKSPSPLSDVFSEFEHRETDYMDTLSDCITERANTVIEAEQEQRRALLETPVYMNTATYARENSELEQYRMSNKANTACKEAIEKAISAHYSDNSLHPGGVGDVVEQFGFDRVLYVLANTVRHFDYDGRISDNNKQWAKTVPVFESPDTFGSDRNCYFVVNSHPGLTDLFVKQARREYLLTQPLTKEEIQHEAARILGRLQDAREPNSPNGTHFVAEMSPDFMLRAKSKDTARLSALLPFKSLALTNVDGRKGVYAVISKDENRNQPLVTRKPSVRSKLKKIEAETKPPSVSVKSKETER